MKFGARYPTAASLLEYVVHAFGNGHLTGVVGWLLLAANAIITAMVAVSFGSYAGAAFADGGSGWTTVFAVLVVVVMTVLNVLGSHAVARAQTIVVVVVIGILALAIATVVYVAVALGVFGTLTVDEVVESGGTALAVAAEPVLGSAGYWLTTVTALFATAGATNAGLYPAAGLCEQMASMGQFPPLLGRNLRDRAPAGLLVTAVAAAVLAVGFDLTSIASLGSAVALVVFTLVTAGHLRVYRETGHVPWLLVVAIAATVVVLVTFAMTTLVEEPATAVTLGAILLLSILLDLGWKRTA